MKHKNPTCSKYFFFIVIFIAFIYLAPTCSPTLTSVIATSSTSVVLSWSPLPNTKCRNGVLRGYRVVYKQIQRGSIEYKNITSSSTITTDVSGLDKYTEYSFQVLAYTVKDGPWSNEMKTKTNEDGILNL